MALHVVERSRPYVTTTSWGALWCHRGLRLAERLVLPPERAQLRLILGDQCAVRGHEAKGHPSTDDPVRPVRHDHGDQISKEMRQIARDVDATKGGDVLTTDGPFAEAKEQIGGF